MKRRRAARGRGGCETRAKAANTCIQPDLQVIYLHWRVKKGWHPARHPCHPLNLLEICKIGLVWCTDSGSFGIILRALGASGRNRYFRRPPRPAPDRQ